MRPTRLAAGGQRVLLVLLLSLLCLLAPGAPMLAPHPASASAPAATRSPAPFIDDRGSLYGARHARLHTIDDPVRFFDVSAAHPKPPAISAQSGILVDIDSDQVLWELNPHARRAPASTTKMMSALVAMNNFSPDEVITIPDAATHVTSVETRMAFATGERLTVRELLRGMLTISANDAALAMADGTVGMDDFVAAMNRQAADLGLSDSHFTGPVGFPDDPDHYSSAYDLAAIGTAAWRHFPMFRDMVDTQWVYLPASPDHQAFTMHNINRLLETYPPAVGLKSGYTDLAGPCLVSMAIRDGHHLVAVLMDSPGMFDQSRAMLEWGFAQEGLPPLPPAPPGR